MIFFDQNHYCLTNSVKYEFLKFIKYCRSKMIVLNTLNISNYKLTEHYHIRFCLGQATKWVHNDASIQDFVRHKITLLIHALLCIDSINYKYLFMSKQFPKFYIRKGQKGLKILRKRYCMTAACSIKASSIFIDGGRSYDTAAPTLAWHDLLISVRLTIG